MIETSPILLISCYELGHPSFGLALLSGLLEKRGFTVETLDLAVEQIDKEKISRAHFLGISVPMHTALRIGVAAAKAARKINPTVPIAFFGLYASLNESFLLEQFDFVIGGEYEGPFVDLIQSCFKGDNTPIIGVSQKGRMVAPNLKSTPFERPSRTTLLKLSDYAHLERDGGRFPVGYVEASRGCRHLCRHCPIPPVYNGRFTVVREEILLEDIRVQVDLGATHITFGDPDFLNGPNHSMRVARQMHQAFPQITFDLTAKIEHLIKYQGLIPELAELGCLFIISAVESLSDTVLNHLDKGHTRTDVIRAIEIVHGRGITFRPSLVPFTPWSTLDDYIDLFDFAEQYHLINSIDPVQFTIRLLVPPGSLLLSEPFMTKFLGPLNQELFTYQWTHPDPRMDRLQVEVSERVEKEGQDDTIFYQLKECALAMREGRLVRPIDRAGLEPAPTKKPPRLSESWFCCAEPTQNQMACIDGINEGK